MTIEKIIVRALDTLMIKEKEEEIEQVFVLIYDDTSSGNQNKKHGVIHDKIENIELEVMDEVLNNEMEDEVLQILLYDRMANIKVEENTTKNKKRVTIEAKVSQFEANKLWSSSGEALTTYTHFGYGIFDCK